MNKQEQRNFTVVIPSKIYDENLDFCIKKIRKFYKYIKIILILDKKKYNIKDKHVQVLISGSKTIGFKRNLAVKKAKTNFITFIDSDAFPKHKWLNPVLKNFKKYKDIHVVGGPNISPPSHNIEKLLVSRVRKLPFVTLDTRFKEKKSGTRVINFFPACNLTIRRKTYNKVGGMITTVNSKEEFSLMKKLNTGNFKMLFNSKTYIYHKERDFKHFFRQRIVYGTNIIYCNLKFFCKETLMILFSTLPFLWILLFPLIFINTLFLKTYFVGIFILFITILISTIKINFSNNLFKSFYLIIISMFGPGIGLIFGIIFSNAFIRKIYTQK